MSGAATAPGVVAMPRKVSSVAAAALIVLCLSHAQVRGDPTLDLTQVSSGSIKGALFESATAPGAGSGNIDSFVGIKDPSAGIVRGYNTTGTRQFETMENPKALELSHVPLVKRGGVVYRQFLLDINQAKDASKLSLDTIEIYVSEYPDLTGHPGFGGNATKVLDLDGGGDAWILLDASIGGGSGKSDMYAYIPNYLFPAEGDPYVYLYSQFGASENSAYPNNDGYEEWGVRAWEVIGKIIVEKQTDPDGSTQAFQFQSSYGVDFALSDGQTNNSGPLLPGTYSVAETLPAGWTLTSAVCSDGSDPGAIQLGPGETVTVVFSNTLGGTIIVEKQTDPDGSTEAFTFTSSYG